MQYNSVCFAVSFFTKFVVLFAVVVVCFFDKYVHICTSIFIYLYIFICFIVIFLHTTNTDKCVYAYKRRTLKHTSKSEWTEAKKNKIAHAMDRWINRFGLWEKATVSVRMYVCVWNNLANTIEIFLRICTSKTIKQYRKYIFFSILAVLIVRHSRSIIE